jgi:hypothetical protein
MFCLCSAVASAETAWIWGAKNNVAKQEVWFRASFELKEVPAKALLQATADNHCVVWLNGKALGGSDDWAECLAAEVAGDLKVGVNTVAVLARNDGGIAAMSLRLTAGKTVLAETGTHWKASLANPGKGWEAAGFADASWAAATFVKNMATSLGVSRSIASPPRTASARPRPPSRRPRNSSCSPISRPSSCTSCRRRSRAPGSRSPSRRKATLSPATKAACSGASPSRTRTSPSSPRSTRSSSAATACSSPTAPCTPAPARRARATSGVCATRKGDGSYAEQVMIRSLKGSGEHGPHQLVLDRDGSILVVGGNHTELPDDEKAGAPVKRYDEDDLLKKYEDANGHAAGIKAVGGWIARMDKDGKDWVRVTTCFRNPYDCAVAPDGDIFTYDSDMEWDMGAPWYRPTRIYLCTPGGELGWRSGASNNAFPTLDMQPPLVDIGPGSPTGTTMGTGAKFPAAYQRAFFACDWTFATLYAIHLTPEGGGWKARKEVFAAGKPFSVTDAVIRPQDGHMYVTIGGRGGQSALYQHHLPGCGVHCAGRLVRRHARAEGPSRARGPPRCRSVRRRARQGLAAHGSSGPLGALRRPHRRRAPARRSPGAPA